MTLPDGWTTRRPTDADVAAILAVVHASDIASVGFADCGADEIEEILHAPNFDPQHDAWLAVDDRGQVVGWAYIGNPHGSTREEIEAYAHPERGVPAQAHLLGLLLARVAARAAENGRAAVTARAMAIPTEQRYLGLLTEHGFSWVKRYARMTRPLTDVDKTPADLPEQVTIRLMRHGDDADMREFFRVLDTAFQDTPDYLAQGYDRWRERIAALPLVEWDEWFVAELAGQPVGVLQSTADLEAHKGWVKNLAVLREARGRGVGQALLRHAFSVYAAKGRTEVGLGVDLTNPTEAYRLYTGVGMTPAYEVEILEREVLAA